MTEIDDGGLAADASQVTPAFLRARLATAYRQYGEITCDGCDTLIDLGSGGVATAIAEWNAHVESCGGEPR